MPTHHVLIAVATNPAANAVVASTGGVDTLKTRAFILLAFIVVLFAVAAGVYFLAKRAQRSRATRDLSILTGTADGAQQGADHVAASTDWYAEAMAGGEEETREARQSWQQAFGFEADQAAAGSGTPEHHGTPGTHPGGSD